MRIPQEVANSVITQGMYQLWETFLNLRGEYPEFEEDYNKVKYGINVKFPIYWIWKENGKIVPKAKEGIVWVDKQKYKESDYEDEKEVRKDILKMTILNNVEIRSTIKPREQTK